MIFLVDHVGPVVALRTASRLMSRSRIQTTCARNIVKQSSSRTLYRGERCVCVSRWSHPRWPFSYNHTLASFDDSYCNVATGAYYVCSTNDKFGLGIFGAEGNSSQ